MEGDKAVRRGTEPCILKKGPTLRRFHTPDMAGD